MAAAYRRLLLLRRIPHPQFQPAAATYCLSPTAAAAAALVKPSSPSAAERIETPLSTLRPGFTSDSNFKYGWHCKLGSSVGAVLIGQAAFFLGLSNGYAFAQEDSVSPAATSEQAEVNATGLQRIEDGSVVSNEHTVKWRIFTDNGRDFFQKRQLDKAEKLFQAALLEAKEGFGLRDPHVASALNNLAEFYRLKQEYEKAELLYLEAIEILEESFGSDDIRVGTALHSLGMCYHLQHKFAQAQTCYERALKIEGRVMGVGHPEYASTMYLLAKVLSVQGKRRGAESLTEESIRILEEAGLGESPTCIQRMRYLSTELIKSKRFTEAEIWQRKILHTLELSKGWDSLHTAHAAEVLSLTLQALEKFKESEELLERSLATKKKVLPEGHFLLAVTLVHLARLSLHKIASDLKNANSNVATYYLSRAQQHSNDSIRITEAILNSSTDQNKLESTSTTDGEKIAATAILLQALDVVGLTDIMAKHVLAPGLVLLVRLPLEHLKHGFFRIDAVHILDTSRPFIWPSTKLIYVSYTTLRIHFKNKFGKVQDYRSIEDALHKCISLYSEPDTRRFVTKAVRQDYLRCLRVLIETVDFTQQTTELQDLLGEARKIIEELGGESNRK
ncbi:hypothetical protein SEVIR_7G012000v4 [Setaria viridis]|uniref:Uncharacterized protein n=2 Tax=Setaria TaxID=4554 RepID=A0A368RT66_SETIT|nr:uncharacterized protein LOC101767382 isoform X2 [Setaria italica]XP_034606060.1 uncharacterized protein LOC117865907 isoform X2 [Setaria viridis]RCV32740.1 hypothetical protein SETIT_7G027900v2 [Setaria italica]TKW03237.1 hypothetical protein SEVIR_7G012000v2 [Setaria viridis]